MFSKPNISESSVTGKYCGLRYEPFEFTINYKSECYLHHINDTLIFDYTISINNYKNKYINNRISGGEYADDREAPWTVFISSIMRYRESKTG